MSGSSAHPGPGSRLRLAQSAILAVTDTSAALGDMQESGSQKIKSQKTGAFYEQLKNWEYQIVAVFGIQVFKWDTLQP